MDRNGCCVCADDEILRPAYYRVFLLPVAALFYSGATIHSAIRYWLGVGGQWKGRVQDQNRSNKRLASPPYCSDLITNVGLSACQSGSS